MAARELLAAPDRRALGQPRWDPRLGRSADVV